MKSVYFTSLRSFTVACTCSQINFYIVINISKHFFLLQYAFYRLEGLIIRNSHTTLWYLSFFLYHVPQVYIHIQTAGVYKDCSRFGTIFRAIQKSRPIWIYIALSYRGWTHGRTTCFPEQRLASSHLFSQKGALKDWAVLWTYGFPGWLALRIWARNSCWQGDSRGSFIFAWRPGQIFEKRKACPDWL